MMTAHIFGRKNRVWRKPARAWVQMCIAPPVVIHEVVSLFSATRVLGIQRSINRSMARRCYAGFTDSVVTCS